VGIILYLVTINAPVIPYHPKFAFLLVVIINYFSYGLAFHYQIFKKAIEKKIPELQSDF
jgi:hypothetical protein